jgi:hypothetical protein
VQRWSNLGFVIEGRLDDADAPAFRLGRRGHVERQIADRLVEAVATDDGGQDDRSVLGRPGHRPQLVHRPREWHRAVAADPPERRAEARDAADP